jgi:tetratricopeptide (TPR) repeat protein
MMQDGYLLPITAPSRPALDAYNEAVTAFLSWEDRALELFRGAAGHDARFALVEIGRALCLHREGRGDAAIAIAARARTAAAGTSHRERSHVDAIALAIEGRTDEAKRRMHDHLATYPRDLMVAQQLYFLCFDGCFPEMLALTTRLLRHHDGNSFLLGMHAFALEQAGQCHLAIEVAEQAIALNPRDAWAVHAVAHALYELAEFSAALARLPGEMARCTGLGYFRNHLEWHLMLMHFSLGDYERASESLRATFEHQPSPIPSDLEDAISMLWRLDLAGRAPGHRWQPFAAIARQRLDQPVEPFHALHLAMALNASGERAAAERQLAELRSERPSDRSVAMTEIIVPLAQALRAFTAADYGAVIRLIEPLLPRLSEAGGSRTQVDVFFDTFLEACFRAGDRERAERFLTVRIRRRPDHFWLHRKFESSPSRDAAQT